MSMTVAQRRKQNQTNAQNSTGPKTPEGKNISRCNSLIHGLTAQVLTLPGESPEQLEAQITAWNDACQPIGQDEQTLVGQLALTSIRLRRLASAEAAVLTEQICVAELDWTRKQERLLLECTRLFKTDPALAFIELKAFGAGVDWLHTRWVGLKEAFKKHNCWNNLELIKDAVRLSGGDPEHMRDEPIDIQEFVFLACQCIPDVQKYPAIVEFLKERSPEWVGRFYTLECATAQAQAVMEAHIERQVDDLSKLLEGFQESEHATRAAAATRASSPDDTPRNRLLYRYLRSAESTLDRTLKTLQKIQADRQKMAENAAKSDEKADLPNEARLEGKSPSSQIEAGSCITIGGREYEVSDATEGKIVMALRSSSVDMSDPGGEAAA